MNGKLQVRRIITKHFLPSKVFLSNLMERLACAISTLGNGVGSIPSRKNVNTTENKLDIQTLSILFLNI